MDASKRKCTIKYLFYFIVIYENSGKKRGREREREREGERERQRQRSQHLELQSWAQYNTDATWYPPAWSSNGVDVDAVTIAPYTIILENIVIAGIFYFSTTNVDFPVASSYFFISSSFSLFLLLFPFFFFFFSFSYFSSSSSLSSSSYSLSSSPPSLPPLASPPT